MHLSLSLSIYIYIYTHNALLAPCDRDARDVREVPDVVDGEVGRRVLLGLY